MAAVRIEFSKVKKNGTVPIFILISHKGSKKMLPTNICVPKSEITKSGKISNFEKRSKVDEILSKCWKVLEEIGRDKFGQEYDVDYIVNRIASANSSEEVDFFEFADEWLKRADIKGKKNYITMLNSLSKFLKTRKLLINDISYKLLSDYMTFLKGKERAQTLYLGAIRHLFREAVRRYNTDEMTVIKNDPFTRFQVPRQKLNIGGKRALTLDELLRIFNYHAPVPGSRARMARDCFILSFALLGMNSADMYSAKRPSCGVIRYQRQKTKDRREDGAYIEVVIQPQIKELCKKYEDHNRLFNFHERYSTSEQFNKSINIGLKEVGEAVGIPFLQFYQARHTFATLSRNMMKFSKSDVDEALNHVGDHAIADVYIAKDFSIINDNNRKLLNKVFGE